MKKSCSLVLFVFIFTLFLPFSAMADNQGKTLFIDNVKAQQQYQLQQQLNYNRPLSGEIMLTLDAESQSLLGALPYQNVKANIKYEMDIPKEIITIKADIQTDSAQPLDLSFKFFIVKDTFIMPVESLQAIQKINPAMEMPADNIEYLYTKIEGFNFAEIQAALDQSGQQEAALDLVKFFIEAIPDSSFSSRGNTAILSLDKSALISLASKFQDDKFISQLADKMAVFDPTGNKDNLLQTLKAPADLSFVNAFKNLKINKCISQIGPDGSLSDWDIAYSDDKIVVACKVFADSNIKQDSLSSNMNFDFNIEDPAEKQIVTIELEAKTNYHQNNSSGQGTLKIDGRVNEEDFIINLGFNMEQKFDDSLNLTAPVLTRENSIEADTLAPEPAGLPDFENMICMNINDEDYVIFDNNPFIENDRILVPVRELGENLNYEVTWNAPAMVTITSADKKIVMKIGEKQYTLNGEAKIMDTAPVLKDGVTYVPVRFIAEELGYQVSFNPEIKEISLKK